MSGEEKEGSKEVDTPSFAKRLSVARRIGEGIPLSDDVKDAVKLIAQAEGKSEQEVLHDVIVKGLSLKSEDLQHQLARKKVLDNITLGEAEIVMRRISNIFSAWTTAPHPDSRSIHHAPQETDREGDMFRKMEKDALKGLPDVPYSPPQSSGGASSTPSVGFGQIMLYNLGRYAIDKFLANPKIEKLLEEKGSGFLEDLLSKLKEEGEL